MKALWLVLLASGLCVASENAQHWSYSGSTAPEKWATLEPDFAACSAGKAQSPVEIVHDAVHDTHQPHIHFAYQPAPLHIIDNGHSIQVNYAPGSFITVGEQRYELVQFHFHHPSEEWIDGKRFDMVAHLVHKDSAGKLAVIAVLLNTGGENAILKTLWANLPQQKEKESAPAGVTINATDLLPTDRSYYSFVGSLTTPPCTEGVRWFVLRHAGSLSPPQLDRFAALYPMDARPAQPLNGREIHADN
jgi:carbonic anhydrase